MKQLENEGLFWGEGRGGCIWQCMWGRGRLKFLSYAGPLLFLSKSVYTEILEIFLVLHTFVLILFSSFCHAFIILIDSDFKDQIVRYKAIRWVEEHFQSFGISIWPVYKTANPGGKCLNTKQGLSHIRTVLGHSFLGFWNTFGCNCAFKVCQ